MFLLDEQDCARGLRVERGRDVEDGLFDEFLDARVGNWGAVGELVDGATVADCVHQRLGGHFLVCG